MYLCVFVSEGALQNLKKNTWESLLTIVTVQGLTCCSVLPCAAMREKVPFSSTKPDENILAYFSFGYCRYIGISLYGG